MRRSNRIDVEWETPDANSFTWETVGVEVLMDIRRELKRLNALLACPNFVGIPETLRGIRRNTAKPKRRPVGKRSRKARS